MPVPRTRYASVPFVVDLSCLTSFLRPAPVAALLAAMGTYDSIIDSSSLARELEITPTRIEDVIRNQLIGA